MGFGGKERSKSEKVKKNMRSGDITDVPVELEEEQKEISVEMISGESSDSSQL